MYLDELKRTADLKIYSLFAAMLLGQSVMQSQARCQSPTGARSSWPLNISSLMKDTDATSTEEQLLGVPLFHIERQF